MGCCCSHYENRLIVDRGSENGDVDSGAVVFYKFAISDSMLFDEKKDILVEVTVMSGRLEGIYVARDQHLPSQRRKVWSQTRYCLCPSVSSSCDHCYPDCSNEFGGTCVECMDASMSGGGGGEQEDWRRTEHRTNLGGHAKDDFDKMAEIEHDEKESQYPDHSGYTFAVRLECRSRAVIAGDYYLSILGLPRHPFAQSDASRRVNSFLVEVRQVAQRGPARLGNEHVYRQMREEKKKEKEKQEKSKQKQKHEKEDVHVSIIEEDEQDHAHGLHRQVHLSTRAQSSVRYNNDDEHDHDVSRAQPTIHFGSGGEEDDDDDDEHKNNNMTKHKTPTRPNKINKQNNNHNNNSNTSNRTSRPDLDFDLDDDRHHQHSHQRRSNDEHDNNHDDGNDDDDDVKRDERSIHRAEGETKMIAKRK